MEVTVSKWTPKHDGNLVGFGDVIVNNTVEIRGCALRKGKEGNLWVSVPSRKYDKDGESKWIGHVGFPSNELLRIRPPTVCMDNTTPTNLCGCRMGPVTRS